MASNLIQPDLDSTNRPQHLPMVSPGQLELHKLLRVQTASRLAWCKHARKTMVDHLQLDRKNYQASDTTTTMAFELRKRPYKREVMVMKDALVESSPDVCRVQITPG